MSKKQLYRDRDFDQLDYVSRKLFVLRLLRKVQTTRHSPSISSVCQTLADRSTFFPIFCFSTCENTVLSQIGNFARWVGKFDV